jgi:uncharacterized protein YndB with AHSA1/START domain/uncharacterized glyoxalase superfamily protein PhnB
VSAPEPPTTARPKAAIPILRIFDQARAYEFYRDFLGFDVVWEHRFEEHAPLYVEVALDGIRLHLSEHHGDASPGGAVIIEIDDARAFQRRLVEAQFGNLRPGLSQEQWGLVVAVTDPFHNRLLFTQPVAEPREEPEAPEVADPIVQAITVPVPPRRAFDAFTADLAAWWNPLLTADAGTFRSADLPPHPGEDATFRHDGDRSYRIGTVTAWRPGERFELSFCLAMPMNHPSTLTVDFAPVGPDGASTAVTLTHGGWDPDNVVYREKYTEWPDLLRRYAAHVATLR